MLPILLALAVPIIILAAGALQKRWARARYLAPRLLMSYLTLLLLLLAGEFYFRYVYTEPGWGFTLAYQNWEDRYWETNRQGFRDREWSPQDWQGKTTVMVLGDSFSAGWGVRDPADRYPDVLARLLGDDYAVVNLSRPGGTPPRTLEWAREHPLQDPDIIIYQYYLNDIDDAALRINDFWAPQFPQPPDWIDEHSHLANFLYWRIVPTLTTVNAADGRSYWEWNKDAFDNFVIFDIHREELRAVMDFAEARDARLIVVIFPDMRQPESTRGRVDIVAQQFWNAGYDDVLRLTDEAAQWDPNAATVSARDAHPSAAFHARVAELLYTRFFAQSAEARTDD
ncbi:MAG: SGNH/GDSL hydrolase family protein [Anaerolineales bacterium]